MTPSEAAAVLARAALYDRRTVGEIESRAWAVSLGDHALDDALAAVDQHYGETDRWIMPAHVNERATVIARRRVGAERRAKLEAEIAAENGGAAVKEITSGGPAPEVSQAMRRGILEGKARRQEREAAEAAAKAERDAKVAEARAELDKKRGEDVA